MSEASPIVERETRGGVARGGARPAAIAAGLETAFRRALVAEAASHEAETEKEKARKSRFGRW